MPTSEIQNFSNLFADLKKFESNCEHDKSLKIVNKSKLYFRMNHFIDFILDSFGT